MPRFSGTPKPQLRLFVIRQHTHTIPPAFAQQVSCHGEADIPELFQHPNLLRLFRFCVFIYREDFFRVLVGLRHLPAGRPGVVHLLLVLIHFVFHGRIFEGESTQTQFLSLPDDHVLDGLEFRLL